MTMLRAAFVPMEWVFSGLSGEALRTLILISSYADRSTGECWPSNRQLANVLGKSERQVRRAISEIEKEGLLFVDQGDGKNRKFRIVSEEWFAKSAPKRSHNPDTKRPGCDTETRTENDRDQAPQPGHKVTGMNGATRTQSDRQPGHFMTGNPDTKRPGPNKKDIQEHIQESSSSKRESFSEESEPVEKSAAAAGTNLEPFESGTPGRLPAVRNGVAPFRPRIAEIVPTKLRPETVDRIADVLGQDGDQFARKITQEQADAGFPEWVLSKAEGGKSPIGFAMHLLKTAWRDGWVNPQTAEDARLEEMAEAMRNLK